MGWEALRAWGEDATRLEPLTGGVANQVWTVRVDDRLAVARLGSRSKADLAWETDLLRHLDQAGLSVPVPIPAIDGRLHLDGLVVMTYVAGEPPRTPADWRRVAAALRQLHAVTKGWPQRPGWRSSIDLLEADVGRTSTSPRSTSRCRTTPPVSGRRTTSPPRPRPPGRPRSAGTTTTPASSWLASAPSPGERASRR